MQALTAAANAAGAFLDAHLAAGRGGRTAIVTPHGNHSYRELLGAASRAGNALRALGVDPEHRVALLLPDGLAFGAWFFGALRIAAVPVPLNPRLEPDELVAILRDSAARVLVAGAALAGALRERLAGLPDLECVATGEPGGGSAGIDGLLAAAPADCPPAPVAPDAMAVWLYTSGTTGLPKAAVHLHRDLLAGHRYGVEVLGISADDRVFATSRLFFAYALGNALLLPLLAGARTFLHPEWPDPALVTGVMQRFRPTLLFSVPTFYLRLLDAAPPPQAFRSLRNAVSAGERLPEKVYQAYRRRYGLEILDGMGATETIFMVLSNRPGHSRPGSSGTPVPGTEVRLLNSRGHEVAGGGRGVLHVKTASASPCYWNRDEASRRAFADGWFRTGDVYTRDADGFYYHCGREDELFKVAGMWVAPAEVEAVLRSHPEVADAAVLGAAEASGLVKCFAFVVPREPLARGDALAGELAGLAGAKLAPHQRPRRIFILPELPRTATGKLQRFRLREQIASISSISRGQIP